MGPRQKELEKKLNRCVEDKEGQEKVTNWVPTYEVPALLILLQLLVVILNLSGLLDLDPTTYITPMLAVGMGIATLWGIYMIRKILAKDVAIKRVEQLDEEYTRLMCELKEEVSKREAREYNVKIEGRYLKMEGSDLTPKYQLGKVKSLIPLKLLVEGDNGRIQEVTGMYEVQVDTRVTDPILTAIYVNETIAGRLNPGYYNGVVTVRSVSEIGTVD